MYLRAVIRVRDHLTLWGLAAPGRHLHGVCDEFSAEVIGDRDESVGDSRRPAETSRCEKFAADDGSSARIITSQSPLEGMKSTADTTGDRCRWGVKLVGELAAGSIVRLCAHSLEERRERWGDLVGVV